MSAGCDGVFVGSGVYLVRFHSITSLVDPLADPETTRFLSQSGDPVKRARAIVQAVTHFNNPKVLAEVSEDLGEAMVGLTVTEEMQGGLMAKRGV